MFLAAPAADPFSLQGEGHAILRRDDGSWLVDGALPLAEFYSAVGVSDPDADHLRSYHTVAGLMISELGRIPETGERVSVGGFRLEVADMDGKRVDKVLVTRTHHQHRRPTVKVAAYRDNDRLIVTRPSPETRRRE